MTHGHRLRYVEWITPNAHITMLVLLVGWLVGWLAGLRVPPYDEVPVKMKSLPYPDEPRMLSSRLMAVA